ncbi:uncharacterized protein Parp1 isoform X6 [Drosophila takahashii]|uniref:uncharacterized protein Parp1 isoform X6 n=1 Tax=Drosophila takahashii TaxID=29030 RepID=UPI0038991EA2
MGQLPKERITPSRPFSRCGIDFCGPVNVYLRIRGKPPSKAYLAVFICFATKAIHVEVVSALTTDSFIAALKRLIARRGLPSDIFCDNATNFAGANNKLESLKQFLFKGPRISGVYGRRQSKVSKDYSIAHSEILGSPLKSYLLEPCMNGFNELF